MGRRICFDIEATGLLDDSTVDYTASPFKLKDTFALHCIVAIDIDTDERFRYPPEAIHDFLELLKDVDMIVGHNIINYDLMVLKAYFGIPYRIRATPEGKDMLAGKDVEIIDTLVWSKALNPDRPGHSIEWWGEKLGLEKIDWRAKAVELKLIEWNAPKAAEFAVYHPAMLEYNERDVEVNILVYKAQLLEATDWDWNLAFWIESYTAWRVAQSSHRGFWFDSDLAERNVRFLDEEMEKLRAIVEPQIPPKPPTQAVMKEYTPPKIQLKQDGTVSAVMEKWVAKHGGSVEHGVDGSPTYVTVFGKTYGLPMLRESLVTEVPAEIKDTTHIKGWFVSLGWEPSSWKERDLTVDQKKRKLSPEKWAATVRRYIEGTIDSPFAKHRLLRLRDAMRTKWSLKYMLNYPEEIIKEMVERGVSKPLKLYTNPQITVGQDKEICPDLQRLEDKFSHTKEITSWLTYRHRRNSILGGGFDPDELGEDEEPEKGYLANVRSDGRIATPADTCGCSTSRYKHRVVANIPRESSLFGREMRDQFGVEKDRFQLGFDFASLEARIEAHYCWRYDRAKDYCNSLLQEKPFDVHTLTAAKIAALTGSEFTRANAKSVKYGVSYGAQVARVAAIVGCSEELAQQIFDAFWEAAAPLATFKEKLTAYWKTTGQKKFILGIDGRKVPTRSAHALVNSAFQSAGVISAKLTAILLEQKLEASGWKVDFWLDDWKNKSYAQCLIDYHDEAQIEITRDLAQFARFQEKAAAEEFVKENQEKVFGAIAKSPKGGYYVSYSPVGEMAAQAALEAGSFLNLKVPLAIEYIVGNNWGACH